MSAVAASAQPTSEQNRRSEAGEETRVAAKAKKTVFIWQPHRRKEALPELRHHGLSSGRAARLLRGHEPGARHGRRVGVHVSEEAQPGREGGEVSRIPCLVATTA